MKNNKIYLILLLLILVIGGCALKDKIIGKEQTVVNKEPDNLQLYLKFDASTIQDLSTYNNSILRQGDFTYTNYYYKFDGKSTYIKIDKDFNKNNELSIGFWINPDQRKDAFILSNGPTDSIPSLYLYYENMNRIEFTRGRELRFTELGSVSSSKWTFIFITSNGSETTLYVNGIKDNTYPQNTIVNTNHTEFYIGKGYECMDVLSSYRCADSYFSGYLDELRIYDKVLSEEEIKSLYEQTKKS